MWDGSYYAGYRRSDRRMRSHRLGVASRYTRSRLPIRLAAWSFTEDARGARSAEALFKGYDRPEKRRVLEGDEAFGRPLHKPPSLTELSAPEEGTIVATLQPPQADELPELVETARTSQARLTTDKGDIVFTFYPDDAPGHAAAFVKLAQAGFYNGPNSTGQANSSSRAAIRR